MADRPLNRSATRTPRARWFAKPLGCEGRQVQIRGRAAERLGEELGGADRQADARTLVAARMPQSGSPSILADDREMVRQYGRNLR